MLIEGEEKYQGVDLRSAIKKEFTEFIQNWREGGVLKYQ
jgi:hypothetical protein